MTVSNKRDIIRHRKLKARELIDMRIEYNRSTTLIWYETNSKKITDNKKEIPTIYKIYKRVKKIASIDPFVNSEAILTLGDEVEKLKEISLRELRNIEDREKEFLKRLFVVSDIESYINKMHTNIFKTLKDCSEVKISPDSLLSRYSKFVEFVVKNKESLKESYKFIFKIQSIENAENKEDLVKIEKAFSEYEEVILKGSNTFPGEYRRLENLFGFENASKEAYISNMKKRIIQLVSKRIESSLGNDFGEYLRELRKSVGLTLAEAGKIAGVSAAYLSRMEKGKRKKPSYAVLRNLASAYKINPNTLFNKAEISIKKESGESFDEDDSNISNFEQVIHSTEFLLKGKVVNPEEKNLVIRIVNKVFELTDKSLAIELIDKVTDTSVSDEMRLNLEVLDIVKKIREGNNKIQ